MIVQYAILNDVHFPFENKSAYAVALKILQSLPALGGIYLNGDIGEFQGVSAWPVHPTEKNINLFAELTYLNNKFDELQNLFPEVPVTYICGNHEYRLFRFIRDLAPQLWGVMPDCPTLLKFEQRPRWKFVDYSVSQIERCGKSNLYLRHEPLVGGANHSKGTAVKASVDIAYGHTHTYQTNMHRKFGPKPYDTKAYSLGFLGDRTRKVFDYRGSKDDWIEGMTVVDCETKSGDYSLEFVRMNKLPVLFRGKLFALR